MRLRRLPMSLLIAALLAACGDAPPAAPVPQQGIHASFAPGGVANLIRIEALDMQPLRGAELVAPDGTATPASYLNAEKTPQTANGQMTLNDPWRSSMLRTNGIPQVPNAALAPAPRSNAALLLIASAAEIPLPDPVAYRRDWAKYRIRLTFAGIDSQLDAREIAAPQPPPG